jgi:hypothetical protein
MKSFKLFLMLFSLSSFVYVNAQDESIFDDKVTGEFKSLTLISTQTTKSMPLKSFEMNIQHRFGKADIKNDFMKNFMGLDLSSNIRLGFTAPITKDIYIGIGRTNYNKVVDAEAKYTFLHQTDDDRIPVFAAFYTSTFVRTYDLPSMNLYDSAFTYKTSHRFSYFNQLIVSRKFSNYCSVLIAPALLYRNIVEDYEKNSTFLLPIGGRLKTTFQTSVLFEYTYIHNKLPGYDDIFAIAYEIATAGHNFQVTLSNNNRISAPFLYTSRSANPLKGQFFIGFNIHRTFFLGKK